MSPVKEKIFWVEGLGKREEKKIWSRKKYKRKEKWVGKRKLILTYILKNHFRVFFHSYFFRGRERYFLGW